MKLGVLLGRASAMAMLLVGPQAHAETLEHLFMSPPKSVRPMVRWWWPGAAVDDVELRREVGLLDDAGFGGAEIQAFTLGLDQVRLTPQERAAVNDYAEPAFFEHVKAAGQAARAHGLVLDYTFGSAWPSGGGYAITPERALVELTMAQTEVTGGAGPIKVKIPARTASFGGLPRAGSASSDPKAADWPARMDARAKIVAVVAMKGDAPTLKPQPPGFKVYPWSDVVRPGRIDQGSVQILTDRLRPDGVLDWSPPPGKWQIFVFKQYAVNGGVLGGAGHGPQLVLDHMDANAFTAHAARVGDPLGDRPAGIRASFVDSLELMQDLPWTERFLAEFRKRRGYDLTPYLPFILQPGWMQTWGEHWSPPYFDGAGGVAERVRADYRRTVSDLMIEGFVEPFVAWNHAHGLKARFQAHGGAMDLLRAYGLADIPETEDLGGGPFFMRLARSAADLYGRPIVSSESLDFADRPYDVTPDELRQRADLNFSGGVNNLVLHGFPYRFHADNWPGWFPFAPRMGSAGHSTMIAESNPIWPGMVRLAKYIARTQAVLRQGESVVPVAYYYGQIGYYGGIEDSGADAHRPEKAFLAAGYDFDRINPDSITSARIIRGRLVARGGARYSVLVLPPIDAIPAETAEAIDRFARAGLPVIFTDHAPRRDEGLAQADRRDARVRAAVADALSHGAKVAPAAEAPEVLRREGIGPNLRFTGPDPSNLVFVQRRVGARTVTFLHNLGDTPRDAGLVLPGRGGVTRWDAMDAKISPVAAVSSASGARIELSLSPGESALLVQDPSTKPVSAVPHVKVQHVVRLQDGWRLRVVGHTLGGTPFSRSVAPAALGDWRNIDDLAHVAGVGVYHRTVTIDRTWLAGGARVTLDLGKVHDMATVAVNGRELPAAITSPFRVELTGALRPGANVVEIKVATTPQNALAASAKPASHRPAPAGLVGPVTLEVAR
jgi:hypothetical protein